MTVFVAGATGATGKWLVSQLLDRGHKVKVVVRSAERLPAGSRNNDNLEIITGSLLDIPDTELAEIVKGCDAVASCLGHNLTFKGMYGQPRKLVRDAVRKLCAAIEVNDPESSVRFVLMNTTGNRNRDLNEKIRIGERIVVALLRVLLPPHPDNEQAAEHLRVNIGQKNRYIEWVAVRPDNLVDDDTVTDYDLHPSPTRDPIFNGGKTSRINVADFMAKLATEDTIWEKWRGQMPVVYNRVS